MENNSQNSNSPTLNQLSSLREQNQILLQKEDQLTLVVQSLLEQLDDLREENASLKKTPSSSLQKPESLFSKQEYDSMCEQYENTIQQLKTKLESQTNISELKETISNQWLIIKSLKEQQPIQQKREQSLIDQNALLQSLIEKLNDDNSKLKLQIEKQEVTEQSVIETSYLKGLESKIDELRKAFQESPLKRPVIHQSTVRSSPRRMANPRTDVFLSRPVIFMTGIALESRPQLQQLIVNNRATVVTEFVDRVTHVVASTRLTLSCLKALLSGKWLVSKQWVLNGMKKEMEYGTKCGRILDGKKVFYTTKYTKSQSALEMLDILKTHGRIQIVNSEYDADICLGSDEEVSECQKKTWFSMISFLKSLPFPKFMLEQKEIN